MRYTIKQLNTMSDKEFAVRILEERRDRLTNFYSPLAEKLRKAILTLENENVQPVKHGHWIDIYQYCKLHGYKPSGMGLHYWCSECNKSVEHKSDYCPNCGAKMDGGGDNSEN